MTRLNILTVKCEQRTWDLLIRDNISGRPRGPIRGQITCHVTSSPPITFEIWWHSEEDHKFPRDIGWQWAQIKSAINKTKSEWRHKYKAKIDCHTWSNQSEHSILVTWLGHSQSEARDWVKCVSSQVTSLTTLLPTVNRDQMIVLVWHLSYDQKQDIGASQTPAWRQWCCWWHWPRWHRWSVVTGVCAMRSGLPPWSIPSRTMWLCRQDRATHCPARLSNLSHGICQTTPQTLQTGKISLKNKCQLVS